MTINPVTYTNRSIPMNIDILPINAFDISLWEERHPNESELSRTDDKLVWILDDYTSYIDISKFQWIISLVKTLTIYGTNRLSLEESINRLVGELSDIPQYLKNSMYDIINAIPIKIIVKDYDYIKYPLLRSSLSYRKENNKRCNFFVPSNIFKVYRVVRRIDNNNNQSDEH